MSGAVADKKKTQDAPVRMASKCHQVVDAASVSAAWKNRPCLLKAGIPEIDFCIFRSPVPWA
jgi:hypothetical protein